MFIYFAYMYLAWPNSIIGGIICEISSAAASFGQCYLQLFLFHDSNFRRSNISFNYHLSRIDIFVNDSQYL